LDLGARVAEVEALYACALTESSETNERQRFAELAQAAARLSELAGNAAGGLVLPAAPPAAPDQSAPSNCSGRARVRRRIAGAEHTADWIIARLRGDSAA